MTTFSPGGGYGLSVPEALGMGPRSELHGQMVDEPRQLTSLEAPPPVGEPQVQDNPHLTIAKAVYGDQRWFSQRDVTDPKGEAGCGVDLMRNDSTHDDSDDAGGVNAQPRRSRTVPRRKPGSRRGPV